jgi:serine/threonine protein kinase
MHGTQWTDSEGNPDSRKSMDLFECIEKFEFFAEPLARHIFSQIINAVAHLHDMGLVHRDIKDENILIDENFNVKLIDFGSAAFYCRSGKKLFDMFLGFGSIF